MSGIRPAEIAPTVPTRSRDGDQVTSASDLSIRDYVLAGAVDGDERVELIFIFPLREKILYATQIADAFFTDVADEKKRVIGFDAADVERLDQSEKHGQAAAVILNAGAVEASASAFNGEIGTGRKHRINVGRDHDRARGSPATPTEHVADRIGLNVRKTQFFKLSSHELSTLLLGERRRRCLRNRDLLFDVCFVVFLDEAQCLLDVRPRYQRFFRRGRGLARSMRQCDERAKTDGKSETG